MTPPDELGEICADVKVCGRRELFALLKFRHKYQRIVDSERKQAKNQLDQEAKKAARVELNESDLEAENDKELEETIKRVEKERKKQEKKERERKVKSELRAKMSVIASTDIYNQNDDILFDRKTLEKLQKVDIEELSYHEDEDDEIGDNGIVNGEAQQP